MIRLRRPSRVAAGAVLALGLAGASCRPGGPSGRSGRKHSRGRCRTRDVQDRGPGQLEWHPLPLQPRLRGARLAEPRHRRGRPDHRRGDARRRASRWPAPRTPGPAGLSRTRCPTRSPRSTCSTARSASPSRTIAWGHSLGGIITAGLIQQFPDRFTAALPMCGVLSGGVATWNTALDSAFAFQQLVDPSVQVVNISIDPKNPDREPSERDQGGHRRAGHPGRARPAGAVCRARRRARLVHPAVARAGRDRLRRPGAEPVPVGHAGRLPVRVPAQGRARGPGGRQPVLEHRRQLRRPAGQVGRLPRGRGPVQGRAPEPGRGPGQAEPRQAHLGQAVRGELPDQQHHLQRAAGHPGAHHAHHR